MFLTVMVIENVYFSNITGILVRLIFFVDVNKTRKKLS